MHDEIKLAPEEVDRVTQVIGQAYTEMETVATGIGGHSQHVGQAYNGSGTGTAMTTYEDLGRAGQALANALDGLSQDLNLTSVTGQQTDADAHGALSGVDTSGISVDLAVARGV